MDCVLVLGALSLKLPSIWAIVTKVGFPVAEVADCSPKDTIAYMARYLLTAVLLHLQSY